MTASRRRLSPLTAIIGLVVPLLLVAVPSPASAQPDGVARDTVVLTSSPGWDLYSPTVGWDYRRSPALVTMPGNVVYRWDCGPGSPLPASPEVIRFSTSSDGGHTWTAATTALQPDPAGGSDARGVCEPSVWKMGTFYFLAYTGLGPTGKHEVYLARATNPAGPYTKWTTNGWAPGVPKPIVKPNASYVGWGHGGPSLVFTKNTLSVYYGWHAGNVWQTRVATVDPTVNPLTWPGLLVDKGTVIEHPGVDAVRPCWGSGITDTTDVKYLDTLDRYVAVTSNTTEFALSAVQSYESDDGLHFQRAINSGSTGATHVHDVSLRGDETGHIDGLQTGLAYSSGPDNTCNGSRLQLSPTGLAPATSGFYKDPLSRDTGNLELHGQNWAWRNNGLDNFARAGWAVLASRQLGASTTIDFDVLPFGASGVKWGLPSPDDYNKPRGYQVMLDNLGEVQLFKDDTVVASAETGLWGTGYHLQVVQANSHISVYLGQNTHRLESMSAPVLEYDDDRPYLGGYMSLVSNGSFFQNLTITDNVPGTSYSGPDWRPANGAWTLPSPDRLVQRSPAGGQNFLRAAGEGGTFYSHLGDGTYTATIKLDLGTVPQGWGGMNIANTSTAPSLDWGQGGYLVFLRGNGNLGVYKAGFGQIVPDVPTGANPTTTPVTIRVVKLGANLQVYVGDAVIPRVNFTDTGAIPTIGGFGVATEGASGSVSNISYAADDHH